MRVSWSGRSLSRSDIAMAPRQRIYHAHRHQHRSRSCELLGEDDDGEDDPLLD